MKLLVVALLGLWTVALAAVAEESEQALEIGDAAPAFSLPGSDGKTYELADFKGEKAVVLAWFPMAFTGG